MELYIDGHVFSRYNQVEINLAYDAINDKFSFAFYFDENNPLYKRILKPGSYQKCTIKHMGVLIMTGIVLSHRFSSAGDPPKEFVYVSGYSSTGVLGDSCILNITLPATNTNFGITATAFDFNGGGEIIPGSNKIAIPPSPLQFDGLTLEYIAHLVCRYYGIDVEVDAEVKKDPRFSVPFSTVHAGESKNKNYTKTEPTQTVAEFLDGLCTQKNVVLSHTPGGKLLLTRAKVDETLTNSKTKVSRENVLSGKVDVFNDPGDVFASKVVTETKLDRNILFDFSGSEKWYTMSLEFNGERMHRIIQVVGQFNDEKPDAALDSAIVNPYVPVGTKRFIRLIQTSGDENDCDKTARAALGDELKNIAIIIEMEGWVLAGHLVTPGQMIAVTNPELHIYKKARMFIQEVTLTGNEKTETATLRCVLPYCFNEETVKNIFD